MEEHDRQGYNLSWHSYSDHLTDMLREMMASREFADVTLVTDDKQQIRAHRSVLSACSPVFKNILQIDSNNPNPIIYLRGIQHSEMESIMQFIYLGETRLSGERASEFLAVSKELDIKELSSNVEMNYPTVKVEEEVEEESERENNEDHANNIAEDVSEDHLVSNEDSSNAKPKKQKAKKAAKQHVKAEENVKFQCQDCGKIFNKRQSLWQHTKTNHGGKKHACDKCDYQASTQQHLTVHTQSMHDGVKYPCDQCGKQFTQKSHMKIHMQSFHEGVKYDCDQCDYEGTAPKYLKLHKQRLHL